MFLKRNGFTFSRGALLFSALFLLTWADEYYDVQYEGDIKSLPYATIEFKPNTSKLSEANKALLRGLIEKTIKKGKIENTIVAAWSDKKIPYSGRHLNWADVSLAASREHTIRKYLKEQFGLQQIEAFNLAQSSNWLAKTFNTFDTKTKDRFSKKGALPPISNAEYNLIKNEGGPGRVVVIIENSMDGKD